MSFRVSLRGLQLIAAVLVVAVAVVLALADWWPFDVSQPALPADPSFWQLMLSDDLTLGFVRLGFVMLAIFVIASVPALIAGGRWIKGFGTAGLTADDAAVKAAVDSDKVADAATKELDVVKQERDQAIDHATRLLRLLMSRGS
jgi:hypothetical protein